MMTFAIAIRRSDSITGHVNVVSCSVIHTPWQRTSGGLIGICHEGVSGKCIVIVPRMRPVLFPAQFVV